MSKATRSLPIVMLTAFFKLNSDNPKLANIPTKKLRCTSYGIGESMNEGIVNVVLLLDTSTLPHPPLMNASTYAHFSIFHPVHTQNPRQQAPSRVIIILTNIPRVHTLSSHLKLPPHDQ
jgi:hypothetical protein